MLGRSNSQEEENLRKEAAKIAYRRKFDAERTARIHNAKQRLIGIPIQELDAQIAEKQRNKAHDKDILNFERAQAQEIERILAASMEEERRMREFQMNQMKQSWEQEAARKKAEKEKPPATDFNREECGPASVLQLKGEDLDRVNRIKEQREQMRLWIQDQIAQKQYVKQLDQEDDLNYADMIKAIDEIREQTEREEAEMRKYVVSTVKADNLELAMNQKQRRHVENTINGADNEPLATSLDCFVENRAVAMDEYGKVKRIDMFRGFTEEQRRTIHQQNQDIIRNNAMAKQHGDRMDEEWVMQQAMAMRAMEQAAYEEACMREAMKSDHLAFLRHQMQEQGQKKAEWDQTKRGVIDEEFFQNFGRGHR